MKLLTCNLFFWLFVSLLSMPCSNAAEQPIERINVIVGLSVRPPFLGVSELNGAGPEILAVLNTVQDQFSFLYKVIPSQRKFQAIKEGQIDVSMWDNLLWGWKSPPMLASNSLVNSQDVFIALAKKHRTNNFFDDVTKKKIAFVYGYHYKIANFETDVDKLSQRFSLSMVRTEEAAIKMVLAKRVEVSIISETALNWFLIRYPEYQPVFLISETFDTQYSRHFLTSNQGVITVIEINQLLSLADKKGLLAPIYRKYGLTAPLF